MPRTAPIALHDDLVRDGKGGEKATKTQKRNNRNSWKRDNEDSGLGQKLSNMYNNIALNGLFIYQFALLKHFKKLRHRTCR